MATAQKLDAFATGGARPYHIPLTTVAFFEGRVEQTDRVLVHLGADYYAWRTASQAKAIVRRRRAAEGRGMGEGTVGAIAGEGAARAEDPGEEEAPPGAGAPAGSDPSVSAAPEPAEAGSRPDDGAGSLPIIDIREEYDEDGKLVSSEKVALDEDLQHVEGSEEVRRALEQLDMKMREDGGGAEGLSLGERLRRRNEDKEAELAAAEGGRGKPAAEAPSTITGKAWKKGFLNAPAKKGRRALRDRAGATEATTRAPTPRQAAPAPVDAAEGAEAAAEQPRAQVPAAFTGVVRERVDAAAVAEAPKRASRFRQGGAGAKSSGAPRVSKFREEMLRRRNAGKGAP